VDGVVDLGVGVDNNLNNLLNLLLKKLIDNFLNNLQNLFLNSLVDNLVGDLVDDLVELVGPVEEVKEQFERQPKKNIYVFWTLMLLVTVMEAVAMRVFHH
jgi:hypothetical protein